MEKIPPVVVKTCANNRKSIPLNTLIAIIVLFIPLLTNNNAGTKSIISQKGKGSLYSVNCFATKDTNATKNIDSMIDIKHLCVNKSCFSLNFPSGIR